MKFKNYYLSEKFFDFKKIFNLFSFSMIKLGKAKIKALLALIKSVDTKKPNWKSNLASKLKGIITASDEKKIKDSLKESLNEGLLDSLSKLANNAIVKNVIIPFITNSMENEKGKNAIEGILSFLSNFSGNDIERASENLYDRYNSSFDWNDYSYGMY